MQQPIKVEQRAPKHQLGRLESLKRWERLSLCKALKRFSNKANWTLLFLDW